MAQEIVHVADDVPVFAPRGRAHLVQLGKALQLGFRRGCTFLRIDHGRVIFGHREAAAAARGHEMFHAIRRGSQLGAHVVDQLSLWDDHVQVVDALFQRAQLFGRRRRKPVLGIVAGDVLREADRAEVGRGFESHVLDSPAC
jgi:hypothetical protein